MGRAIMHVSVQIRADYDDRIFPETPPSVEPNGNQQVHRFSLSQKGSSATLWGEMSLGVCCFPDGCRPKQVVCIRHG